MIEIHSNIFCECDARYHHMFVQDVAPAPQETIKTICPICSAVGAVVYEFEATCNSCNEYFKINHFANNDGSTDTEYFPRECECGKEFILQQRRVK